MLPLTFLFDIFGGAQNSDNIEENFPEKKCRAFVDNLVLMDEQEKIFAHHLKHRLLFVDNDVQIKRRATTFVSGGFLAYVLGLTNDYNDIDIYIEYDQRVFEWVQALYDDSISDRFERCIWLQQDTYVTTSKIQTNDEEKLWDGLVLFRNYAHTLVHIRYVFSLNGVHPTVQHWKSKYGNTHLPQIIFYESPLKLDNYTILKFISGFDLPIVRNALVFDSTFAFHLREFILEKLYGQENIAKSAAVRTFINCWKRDEQREIHRITKNVKEMAEYIKSPIRAKKYKYSRNDKTFNNARTLISYLKFRRRMVLIRFPFDSLPSFNPFAECETSVERIEKYKQRIVENTSVDYHGNNALPLKVYPLKYLAYWKLLKLKKCSVYNCLCNFDFQIKK